MTTRDVVFLVFACAFGVGFIFAGIGAIATVLCKIFAESRLTRPHPQAESPQPGRQPKPPLPYVDGTVWEWDDRGFWGIREISDDGRIDLHWEGQS